MDRNAHLQALQAAARVAFAVTFVAGCSAAPTESESAQTASDLKSKSKEPSCHGDETDAGNDATTPVSCEAVIAAAFPTAGNYPGTKQNVSKEVQACCTDSLVNHELGEHRWDCCANATPGADIGLACTPWGPPVPPSMFWREVA